MSRFKVGVSKEEMKMLVSKGRIPYLKTVTITSREPYILGRQKKSTFMKIGHPSKSEKLELVHSDVYGPTLVSLIRGSRYYVIFIDE